MRYKIWGLIYCSVLCVVEGYALVNRKEQSEVEEPIRVTCTLVLRIALPISTCLSWKRHSPKSHSSCLSLNIKDKAIVHRSGFPLQSRPLMNVLEFTSYISILRVKHGFGIPVYLGSHPF